MAILALEIPNRLLEITQGFGAEELPKNTGSYINLKAMILSSFIKCVITMMINNLIPQNSK